MGADTDRIDSQELPPGPSLPGPLQTARWLARPLPFLEQCARRFGETFTLRIRNELTWVVISNPEDVREVFTAEPSVMRAGEANVVLAPILGATSLLLLDEPAHMEHRRLMLPPFHGKRMEQYRHLIEEVTLAELSRWPRSEPFALWPSMQAITLEVIMRAVFGITDAGRLHYVREVLRTAVEWLADRRRLAMMALLGPERLKRSALFTAQVKRVDEALLSEISNRRRAEDLDEREDILSMMILAQFEDGGQMSDRELRDELLTLLLAGHETTATSLAWAFERLVRHPEKLARLREEASAGGQESYLEAVVKETLRLRPVVPIVIRKLAAPTQIGRFTLPKGVGVVPCIHLVHRRPEIYREPHAFKPERFLEKPAGTYTWIPFGGGVRRCLGASFAQMEMKEVLRTVLSEVNLSPADRVPEPIVRRSITLAPKRRATVLVSA